MILNNIFQQIEQVFTLEKIKEDFNSYIEFEKEKDYKLVSFDREDFEEQEFLISPNDSLHILAVKLKKSYLNNSYGAIQIDVAIGNIKPATNNIVPIEKCIAEMMYDDEYNLFTIDFVHSKIGYA